MSINIITIDGPASSGKGTVAKIVAGKLGYFYLDSGSIYRMLGLIASRNNLIGDVAINELLLLIKKMKLEFVAGQVRLDDEDVTDLLRDEKIGMLASSLAKIPEIRAAVLDFQRGFARPPGLVTDGRDMGSVVFPGAKLKVFLTAGAEVRAKRRCEQLQSMGKSATMSDILHDIETRDLQDRERKTAPLMHDGSFKILDNSALTIDETVEQILEWFY